MIVNKIFNYKVNYLTQKDDDSLIQFLLTAIKNKAGDINNHWRFEKVWHPQYLGTEFRATTDIGGKIIASHFFIEDIEMIHYAKALDTILIPQD